MTDEKKITDDMIKDWKMKLETFKSSYEKFGDELEKINARKKYITQKRKQLEKDIELFTLRIEMAELKK